MNLSIQIRNLYGLLKEDWYDLDHLYFRDHQNSLFFKVFKEVNEFPDYLPYYPSGAIIRQVRYIANFYLKSSDNLDRDYIYLTLDEMNLFLNKTVVDIKNKLNKQLDNRRSS